MDKIYTIKRRTLSSYNPLDLIDKFFYNLWKFTYNDKNVWNSIFTILLMLTQNWANTCYCWLTYTHVHVYLFEKDKLCQGQSRTHVNWHVVTLQTTTFFSSVFLYFHWFLEGCQKPVTNVFRPTHALDLTHTFLGSLSIALTLKKNSGSRKWHVISGVVFFFVFVKFHHIKNLTVGK